METGSVHQRRPVDSIDYNGFRGVYVAVSAVLMEKIAQHVVLFVPSKLRNYPTEAPKGTSDGSVDQALMVT